jgi:hypothetical protein
MSPTVCGSHGSHYVLELLREEEQRIARLIAHELEKLSHLWPHHHDHKRGSE